MALSTQPTKPDMLVQNGFRFFLKRLPHVNYFTQSADVPGITLGVTETPTPHATLVHGGKLTYDPYQLIFKVDEDMRNFMEIQDWMVGLGHPQGYQQTAALIRASDKPISGPAASESRLFSDATLFVQNNTSRNNLEVTFQDMFPTALTGLTFRSTDAGVEYLEATATFRYKLYTVRRMNP